jgi:hypothetical protein
MPNSLPNQGYDFRKPLTVAWSASVPSLLFGATTWKDAANPPNRVVQYYLNTGFCVGFLKDYGIGKALQNSTTEVFELRNNTGKVYPHGVNGAKVGSTMPANKIYSAVMFRAFTDLTETATGGRMSCFYFTYNNILYVFLDYSATMYDHIVIDNAYSSKKIEVVESANAVLLNDVYNNGFYVQATYVANETCFMVLRILL